MRMTILKRRSANGNLVLWFASFSVCKATEPLTETEAEDLNVLKDENTSMAKVNLKFEEGVSNQLGFFFRRLGFALGCSLVIINFD
ncbi:unnamed protein product [Dibothriocephalus latus]|uniref:Uncharacterized protein n=1 Tax=Dibothriocephalus latus TaxID=60516 RepID=A0A3P7LDW8_DIBLA|nr:unnamed protein product [Dibothriocephalus latus]